MSAPARSYSEIKNARLSKKRPRRAIPSLLSPVPFRRSARERCVNVTECAQVFFKCSSMLPARKTRRYKNNSSAGLLPLPITHRSEPSDGLCNSRDNRDDPSRDFRMVFPSRAIFQRRHAILYAIICVFFIVKWAIVAYY